MIKVLTGFPDSVVAATFSGTLSRQDYQEALIPAVEAVLQRNQKVRVYAEVTPELAGVEPGAIWEDIRVGIGHWSRWERIAVVSDFDWIRQAFKFFRFLIPGDARVFPLGERDEARHWLTANGD